MIVRLVGLRFVQMYRGSGDLGLFRVLLLIVVLIPLVAIFLVQHIAGQPWPLAIPATALYIVYLVHRNRKDYHFLLAITARPQVVFVSEYLLFTMPVTALLLWAALYIHALVFCAIIILIAFLIPSREVPNSRTVKLRIIPAGMFEWQSGIRKNLFVVVLFYIPGMFGFYQEWLSAVSLLILTMIFTSFYSEYEPLSMLMTGNSGPWKFLAGKVAVHTGRFALFLLPLLAIALMRGDYRLIAAGYFLASINLLAFSILLKYYQYRPGAYSGAHQMLTTLACFISVILPVALLFIIFNLLLVAGASGNLKKYLDVNN